MDLAMKMHDAKQEGLKSGIKQGKREGIENSAKSIAITLRQQGQSKAFIQHLLSDSFGNKLPTEKIKDIINSLK